MQNTAYIWVLITHPTTTTTVYPSRDKQPWQNTLGVTSPEPLPGRNCILCASPYQQLFPDKPGWVSSDGRAGSRAPNCIRAREGLHPSMPSSTLPVQAAGMIFKPRRLCGTVVGRSRSGCLKTPTQSENTNSIPKHQLNPIYVAA